MRAESMPREARYSRTFWARLAPSAMLYSRVPRSSACLNRKGVAIVLREPLRLFVEGGARLWG